MPVSARSIFFPNVFQINLTQNEHTSSLLKSRKEQQPKRWKSSTSSNTQILQRQAEDKQNVRRLKRTAALNRFILLVFLGCMTVFMRCVRLIICSLTNHVSDSKISSPIEKRSTLCLCDDKNNIINRISADRFDKAAERWSTKIGASHNPMYGADGS